jgi:diguanylate cyclase
MEDAQALLTLGCTRAQGFLFSKPLPGAQMGPLFADRFFSVDVLNGSAADTGHDDGRGG